MPKYEIQIGVGGGQRTGGGGGGGRTATPELRQQVQHAKEMSKSNRALEKNSSNTIRTDAKLGRNIERLIRTNERLINAITQSNRRGGIGGGGGGGGGGRGGGGLSLASGGGIGRMGAAIPILGIAFGALGFAMSQIMRIGRAHLERASQQAGTAGIAGTRYKGRAGYYDLAQMGQLVKARRMGGGYYDESAKGTRFEGTMGEVTSGLLPQRPARGRYNEKAFEGAQNRVLQYGKKFGIGAEDIGRQMGLMDVMTQGKGAQQMRQTYGTLQARGIETEIPLVMQTISQSLEEAVENGVNASNLASEMADEIGRMTRYSPNLTARSAMQVQRGLSETQMNVARGQFQSPAQFQMFQIARGQVREMMGGGGNQEVLKGLVQQGLLTQGQIEDYRKSGGKSMSPEMERFLTQSYLAQKPEGVRGAYMEDIAKRFGGEGGTMQERMYRAFTVSQGYGLSPGAELPQQFAMMYKTGEGRRQKLTPTLTQKDIDKGATGVETQRRDAGTVFVAQERNIKLQEMQMTSIAISASKTVLVVEQQMQTIASTMSSTVTSVIGGLTSALKSLGGTVDDLIWKINKIKKEGSGFFGGTKILFSSRDKGK